MEAQMASAERSAAGRIHDPVFIFMVAAMVLAVISSIALRTMVSGSGPASAHAAESTSGDNMSGEEGTLPPAGGATQFHHAGLK
jgi:hypothetical protein